MAESKVYQHEETALTFKSTGGSALFTPTGLLTAAGRQSAYYDLGVAARSRLYAWRAVIVPGATRVVGEKIRIYLITSDGAKPDNDDGTGDIAVSSIDKLRNLDLIGEIQVDENAAVPMVAHGLVELPHRWIGVAFWNATANTLSATATDFLFTLTPVPDAVQAQA